MQVNKPAAARLEPASKTPAVSPATVLPPRSSSVGGRSRTDQVDISDAGRTMAGAHVREGVTWVRSEPDAARLDEIRARIASGAYLTPEVEDHVARAILTRGDL